MANLQKDFDIEIIATFDLRVSLFVIKNGERKYLQILQTEFDQWLSLNGKNITVLTGPDGEKIPCEMTSEEYWENTPEETIQQHILNYLEKHLGTLFPSAQVSFVKEKELTPLQRILNHISSQKLATNETV